MFLRKNLIKKSLKVLKNGYKVIFSINLSFLNIKLSEKICTDKVFFKNCKMAQDYINISKWPSVKKDCRYVKLPGKVNVESDAFDFYSIYTIYDKKIRHLNKKFKRYCDRIDHLYTPYRLYIIKNNKSCYYHLHTEGMFFEFFSDKCLKDMIMRFESYVNGLDDIKIPMQKKKNLTKIEAARQKMVDSEINRSYDYIKALKKLKK